MANRVEGGLNPETLAISTDGLQFSLAPTISNETFPIHSNQGQAICGLLSSRRARGRQRVDLRLNSLFIAHLMPVLPDLLYIYYKSDRAGD